MGHSNRSRVRFRLIVLVQPPHILKAKEELRTDRWLRKADAEDLENDFPYLKRNKPHFRKPELKV